MIIDNANEDYLISSSTPTKANIRISSIDLTKVLRNF